MTKFSFSQTFTISESCSVFLRSKVSPIEVRNKKKESINIVIEDQFPIPTNSEIEVEREAYAEAELNEETGILEWKFQLSPSGTKKVNFRYSVKYPKKKIVRLD